ncbi:MAG: hypothetical protein J7L25_14250 [Deltaproteobacteria bacterium]|nr:hypothetical protein [Candidatus Tharpella aukensis]
MTNSETKNQNQERIKQLEEEIEKLSEECKWCHKQVYGLGMQISDGYRNNEYWDTKDLMKQRRSEALALAREIEVLTQELEKLKLEVS